MVPARIHYGRILANGEDRVQPRFLVHPQSIFPNYSPAFLAGLAFAHLALAAVLGVLGGSACLENRRGVLGLSRGEIPWIFQAQVYRQDFPWPTHRGCCSPDPKRNSQTSSG